MKKGFDKIADALGDQARRQILLELSDHNPVEQRAAVETNNAETDDDSAVQLLHVHLPKLDNMGYIEWKREQGNIVKGPHWEEIEPVVRFLSDNKHQLPVDTF